MPADPAPFLVIQSLILAAVKQEKYARLIDVAVQYAKEQTSDKAKQLDLATDRLLVAFGVEILKIIPGRVSTEVDARLSFDKDATIAKAKTLIALYESLGVKRERVLIKIASTWEGIRAAEILEKEGIHCNLTLLFGVHQAIACAEAGVTLISPFVGRILDWYKKSTGKSGYEASEDPGVMVGLLEAERLANRRRTGHISAKSAATRYSLEHMYARCYCH